MYLRFGVPSEDPDAKVNATIDHYESDDLPSGSIAVLSDGRRLVTAKAFERIWHIYCMYRKGELRTPDGTRK